MIVYDRLWQTLKERGISQYRLVKDNEFSPAQITRLKRNQPVNTTTLGRICDYLGCSLEDIAENIPENESSENTVAENDSSENE